MRLALRVAALKHAATASVARVGQLHLVQLMKLRSRAEGRITLQQSPRLRSPQRRLRALAPAQGVLDVFGGDPADFWLGEFVRSLRIVPLVGASGGVSGLENWVWLGGGSGPPTIDFQLCTCFATPAFLADAMLAQQCPWPTRLQPQHTMWQSARAFD